MHRRVLVCTLIVSLVLLLGGCQRPQLAQGVLIESFCYEVFSTAMGSETTFSIAREEEGFIVTQSSGSGQFVRMANVEREIMVQATDILRAHDALSWNGFEKSNPLVLDGTSFTLHIVFDNGMEISAKGTNSRPKGLSDAMREIEDLFDRFLSEPDQ